MSQLLIQQYLNQLATLRKVSGTQRESVVREAFKDLLKGWAKSHDLVFIPEYELESKAKERRYVDGALLYELRVPFGYWEAKDPDDDLDAMVAAKFKRGYARFFRWASDRLDGNGILALITNRSFIESRTFDGFRDTIAREFNDIYLVDLGGDVRSNPKLSGTTHNVFGIQTGVAISFMIRRAKQKGSRIFYARRPEFEKAEEKLDFLSTRSASDLDFAEVRPDTKRNWINHSENDFDDLPPVINAHTDTAPKQLRGKALFRLKALGISTNRDQWLYDIDIVNLTAKTRFLSSRYESHLSDDIAFDTSIKWSETLKRRANASARELFDPKRIRRAEYRPFVALNLYQSALYIDRPGQLDETFPVGATNRVILFTQPGSQKPFMVCAAMHIVDLHFVGAAAGTECLPFYEYDSAGHRAENVTDWALDEFRKRYQTGRASKIRSPTREEIFHYVYGVLHDPNYREKYALNLKREFPRIPFYKDFWQWSDWGKELMEFHIGYESVEPWKLKRTNVTDEKAKLAGQTPKSMLKVDKEAGRIVLDSETTLAGIPPEAWNYRLGNRSALEWILDQYKESKPKDPTIREKFDTYRFADYKEKVIDLLARVTRVSVETQRIVEEMKKAQR